jgi:hypothetical protein
MDGDDVLGILLAQPETAAFVVRKLWREFVSLTPDEREVARIAAVFRDSRYDIKAALRSLLESDAFWAPENRGALIKSPVELVVGTLRTFEMGPMTLRPAVVAAALLGQNVMSPPNVKGWPGGEAWINSATLLARKQFVERLFRGSDAMGETSTASGGDAPRTPEARFRRMMERGMATYSFDWDKWSKSFAPGEGRDQGIERLVLATAAVNQVRAGLDGRELVRALAGDPAFQLK